MTLDEYQQLPEATVADTLEFDAWPESQKRLARIVVGSEMSSIIDDLKSEIEDLKR